MGLLVSNPANPCACAGSLPSCTNFYNGSFNLTLDNPSGHWQSTVSLPSPVTNPPTNCRPTLEIIWPVQTTPIVAGLQTAYFLVGLSSYNAPWSYAWNFSIIYAGSTIFNVNGTGNEVALQPNLQIKALTDPDNWVWGGPYPPNVIDNNNGSWGWKYFGAPSAAPYPTLMLDLQVSGPPGANMGGGELIYFTSNFYLAL